MNEILEKLLKILPAYLSDLFALTISPKKFLNTRNLKDNKKLEQSALFFAISLALTFLLQTPLLPINQNLLYLFVELLIIEITGVAVGFHWSADDTSPYPDAWCSNCNDAVGATGGEWTDEVLQSAGVSVLCGCCYQKAKAIWESVRHAQH